jgi:hypothetical protein
MLITMINYIKSPLLVELFIQQNMIGSKNKILQVKSFALSKILITIWYR